MRRKMPPLNHLRAFEAAARHQSFTRAAEELFVTQGAVSRHVRTLEDYLGFSLFERSSQGLQLSAEGRKYAAELTKALNHISRASDDLVHTKRRFVIVLRSYTNLTMRWLIPHLPDFYAKYPEIQIRLVSARTDCGLKAETPSIAIRFGAGEWDGLDSRFLFKEHLTPFCTPEVASRLDPFDPASLNKQVILSTYERQAEWAEWFNFACDSPFKPEHEQILDDPAITYECVLSGLGVGLGNIAYLSRDMEAGRIQFPYNKFLSGEFGYYVVALPALYEIPEVRMLSDWLVSIGQSAFNPEISGKTPTPMRLVRQA